MPARLRTTSGLLVQLCLTAAWWSLVECFLSPTSERTYGHVSSRALCLDFDRELLQHLTPFNFTLHSRRPLGELKACPAVFGFLWRPCSAALDIAPDAKACATLLDQDYILHVHSHTHMKNGSTCHGSAAAGGLHAGSRVFIPTHRHCMCRVQRWPVSCAGCMTGRVCWQNASWLRAGQTLETCAALNASWPSCSLVRSAAAAP